MAAGARAGQGLVLLLAALAGTSGKAPAECPATCYKMTCDHWVDELGHSCEMLETTDMCDCSGCWCGQSGDSHGVDRGGHGAHAEAAPDITSPKTFQNFNCLDSLTTWDESWSEEKKLWCCEEEGLGCPVRHEIAPDAGKPPFDCLLGVADWRGRWIGDKERWCCSHRGLGCNAAMRAEAQLEPGQALASSAPVSTGAPTKTTTLSISGTSTSLSTTGTSTSVSTIISTVSAKSATSTTPAASTTSTSTSTTPTTPRVASASSSIAFAATASSSAPPAATTSSRASSAEPTAAPGGSEEAFDCLEGVRNWQDGWPDAKKDWCCVHEGLGCAQDSIRALDCLVGLRNWTVGWTTAKQAECCDIEGLGCPVAQMKKQGAAEFDCLEGVKERATLWAGSKRSWCCRNEGLGCPPTWAFDCLAGIENWRLEWSGPKRQWCCRAEGLGCQTTPEVNTTSDPAPLDAIGDSDHKESLVELPAWWLLLGIVPGGGEGRFSEEQRRAFGVNRDGGQLDTDRFALAAQAAYSAFCTGLPGGPDDPPPWWYLFGIQPASYAKREGKYQNVTFSKQQREYFGVDVGGAVTDEGRMSAALESLKAAYSGKGELPAWEILGGPAFSRAHLHHGEVQDLSIRAPAASAPVDGGAVPWWLAAGVQPASFERAGGAFSGVAFSTEQQEAFGVDVEGAPTDRSLFKAVGRVISEAAAKGGAALPPWWALQGVAPRGWIKRVGQPPAPIFSEAQEAYFGVDQRGSVVDSGRFLAATAKGKAPPAWWILLGVQPKRAGTDGTKTVFSHLQQERFGVDAVGRVVNHPCFDAATRALRASGVLGPDPHQERTPWWIMNSVMPASFRKDSGWYLQVTFSARQQGQFGVDAGGEVVNAVRHDFALRTLKEAQAKGELLSDGDMLLAWQREVEMNNSLVDPTTKPASTIASSSQPSTTLLSSASDTGALVETAAELAEVERRDAKASQDETFALEMVRLLRNNRRMRDDALEKLGFAPASDDPVHHSIGGFDPSLLGVASAHEGGDGGEPEAAAGGEGPKKKAGEEDSSATARFLEKPTDPHAAVLEVACRSAADALQQSRRAAWITRVKVSCGELAQAQAAQDRCFLASARAIAEADREVRWLAERGCRRTASSPRSPGLLGMLGTLANSTWERVIEIRNQSDAIYEEAVALAVGDAEDMNPQVDQRGIEAVASLMCEDAIALDVTRAVQFKTAQLTRACTKQVEAGSSSDLGTRAANACLEAGFSALAAVGQDVSGCFLDACRAFVAASGVRRLAVDTHEAVRRFKAVAGNGTLPAGCESVAGTSSDGLEGSIQVLMSAVLANVTSRGSAVAGARVEEASPSPGKPRPVNDKFLVRFGDAAVGRSPLASAGAVALAGLLVLMAAACGAALQLRSRTLRYHTVRVMPSQTLLPE